MDEEFKKFFSNPPPFVFEQRMVNGKPITEEEAKKMDEEIEKINKGKLEDIIDK